MSRGILSPLRLPIPPPGQYVIYEGWGRNRTGVHGFAGRCITTLPPSRIRLLIKIGAGNETRTRDPNLGKVVLYQLSYSRPPKEPIFLSTRYLESSEFTGLFRVKMSKPIYFRHHAKWLRLLYLLSQFPFLQVVYEYYRLSPNLFVGGQDCVQQ